ncbi:MAG: hypothetical protein AUG48_07965 [Actinobacteria bacterium 13_1_20CM_3_68_9]|nr:MAG: hypothetical protein AUG48_07965 [Actinobacteria bacterium 13_1_20CM_3_68_9]
MAEGAKSAQDSLADRVVAGDKRALARAISLVENRDPEGDRLVAELFPRTGRARIVGVTGPPGVGKSTLIGALTAELRKAERNVGVLSIDPSSPFTQGAMLGDRIRLADHFLDPGVFIRSMATRGSLGGLAEAALQAALLMDASGKDDVLLETVGVGQGEVDVVDHADTIVLALMPGSGDSIQALKAGVMEIPDVIVVNKSEHPLADTMVREVRAVLSLGPQNAWKVPVVRTEATKDQAATFAPRCWGSPLSGCVAAWSSEPAGIRSGKGSSTASFGVRRTPPRRRGGCWRRPAMIERAKATESERAEPPGPELAERDGDALTARPAS